jgi:hypothetical protein
LGVSLLQLEQECAAVAQQDINTWLNEQHQWINEVR